MEDCIFCKIIKGEIPSHKVYEDENVLAFLDINPFVVGHTLVIPKKHAKWVWDLEEPDYFALMQKVKTVAEALRKTFNTEWVGEGIIGVDVPHAHVQIMPRRADDGLGGFPAQRLSPKPTDEELNKVAEKIKVSLN